MPPKTFYVGVDPDEPYSIKGRVTQYTSIKDGVELPIGSLVQRWDTVAPVGPTFIPAVDVEPWRQVGDPDADEVLEILGLGPGVDALNAVQAEATKEGGNPKVKAFWQKVLAGPEGKVDHQLIKEGQGIYHKYSIHFFFALLYNSLIGGFASPNFNGVLRETGYMTSAHKEATWKRLLETTIFFIDAMNDLTPGSAGWKSTLRVRFLHAQVRRKILLGKGRVNKYDHAAFGVPINQSDLAVVWGGFVVAPVWAMRRMGVHLTRRECEAYQATWKSIGFTLGIQPHILDRICHPSYIDTEISFISLFFAVFPRDAPSQPPTSTATTTYGLLNAVNGRPPLAKARMEFHVEFTRSLLGPEFADQLALPKGNLFDRLCVRGAQRALSAVVEFEKRWRSGWRAEKNALMTEYLEGVVVNGLGKRRTVFAWREEKDWADVLRESESEGPGIKLDDNTGRNTVRRWQLLILEFLLVVLVAAAGVTFVVHRAWKVIQ